MAWARGTCPCWFTGVAPGCVMARALACLPWLPVWRHEVPRARCPPWHGRRDAPGAPAADDAAAEQLVTTVRDLDVGSALADPWAAQTSDSAETANGTAYPLYYLMATGWRSRRTPWKPCGLCTRSGTYKTPQTYWWSSCNTQGDSACSEPPIRRGPTAWSSALSVTCRTRTGCAAYRARPSQVGGGRRHR